MLSSYRFWYPAGLLLLIGGFALSGQAAAQETVDFDQRIKPLLSDRCYFCHGPDAENRQADLRLDVEAAAKERVIEPGKPGESELIARIFADDPDVVMPPPSTKLSLTEEEKQLLRRWVESGAPWQEHWAFVPPVSPAPPALAGDDWSRGPIDQFVLQRMRTAGLQPSPAASRETLIRRLSFDLTGLPPTREQVRAFLQDTSQDAVEKVVDRLLKSPHYGERMAASWLDAARYSDTYGYQVDRDRYVWPWRDWVVEAFNRNLPYDQFITEQLAGDLLPNASDQQILATTFNRLHPQKVEGGSTPEEFRVEYVADRTQTFATALLGLTMECCRCHDHKYDPISQREYYQLSAFFDNVDEAGLYSYFTPAVPTPTLAMMDDAAKQKLAKQEAKVAALEAELAEIAAAADPRFQAWLAPSQAAKSPKELQQSDSADNPDAPEFYPGQLQYLAFEDGKVGGNQSVPGKFGKGVKLTGDDAIGLRVGNFKRHQPFSISLWMNTPDVKQRAVVFHRSRAWTDAGSRGYQLLIEDGSLSASLIHFWPGNAIRVRTREPLPTNQWVHVAWTYDGSSKAAGLKLFVDGVEAECEVVRDNLYKHITGGGGDKLAIGERFRDRGFTNGRVDEFRVFERRLSALEVPLIAARQWQFSPQLVNEQLTKEYYLWLVDQPFRAKLGELQAARETLFKQQDSLREIMVMREMETPRQTYLLDRGAYDARGAEVSAAAPEVLGPMPADAPRNRLGLAKWLLSPENPLAARVAVNRIWQQVMGQGIVRTPEDFGRQGQPPTHPLLLDWLASDFVEHGWDIKRLIRQIVLSATYQQASDADGERRRRDPANLYWSRAEAFRLPAEMLRDQALRVSGLLVDKQGGPPAKPYELEASFKPSKRDRGEGLYRRSLYTYWKRTGPAPMMMVLDSAKRDVCRVKRERTATPLQAFVMMNSPQFVEAARVYAEQLLSDATIADDRGRVVRAFETLTSRLPTEDETELLVELLAGQTERFAAHPEQAKQYRQVGDHAAQKSLEDVPVAALTAVINALFNFDEVLMRR